MSLLALSSFIVVCNIISSSKDWTRIRVTRVDSSQTRTRVKDFLTRVNASVRDL